MTEQIDVTVMFQSSMREVHGSNLGSDTGYPDRYFVLSHILSRQILGWFLDWATSASFQILSSSPFILRFDAVEPSY
jgi:hypothetical protein